MTRNPTWTRRLQTTSNAVHVSLFLVAVAVELVTKDATTKNLVAMGLALAGVLVSLTLRIPFSPPSWTIAARLTASTVLYLLAIASSGGVDSTYTLLPVAGVFVAAAGGGLVYAAPTAIGSIVGVFAMSVGDTTAGTQTAIIRMSAIYAITAVAFSEVRRAIVAESVRTEDMLVASDAAHTRIARLTATHELLADLVRVARSPDINAVTTARDAVRDIGLIVPDVPTRIVTAEGMILAKRGATPHHPPTRFFPITCENRDVAQLDIWDKKSNIDSDEREAIELAVQPVGLAIDNDLLLQQVAGITIQRERVRLARELHDDVAPSMAAIGLSLDMTIMSGGLSEEQTRNLTASRSNISRLVEQIRNRVQDLRADRSVSIVEMAHTLVSEVDADGPTVVVNIDERTPPRAAIAAELGAFMTEAFRNALYHADASAIWITGRVTETEGFLAIQDNGSGFDLDDTATNRFGLVGMEERAAMISGEFELTSAPGEGTVVSMAWKDGV